MKKRQIIVAALSLALAAANSVPALAAAANSSPSGNSFSVCWIARTMDPPSIRSDISIRSCRPRYLASGSLISR